MKNYQDLFYVKDGVLHSREELKPESELEALLMSVARWVKQVEYPNARPAGEYDWAALCAMCKYYQRVVNDDAEEDDRCAICPLDTCGRNTQAAYLKFRKNPTSENAQAMVDELISLCPDWVQGLLMQELLGESVEEIAPNIDHDYGSNWQANKDGNKAGLVADTIIGDTFHVGAVIWTGHYASSSAKTSLEMGERIALCMNACQGISNEELEGGLNDYHISTPMHTNEAFMKYYNAFVQDRNEYAEKKSGPTVAEVCELLEDFERIEFFHDGSGGLRLRGGKDERALSFNNTKGMMRKLINYASNR